jgi:hypothetical protein
LEKEIVSVEGIKEVVQLCLGAFAVIAGFTLMYFKPELKTEAMSIEMLVLGYYFGSSPGSISRNIKALKETIKGGCNETDRGIGS